MPQKYYLLCYNWVRIVFCEYKDFCPFFLRGKNLLIHYNTVFTQKVTFNLKKRMFYVGVCAVLSTISHKIWDKDKVTQGRARHCVEMQKFLTFIETL
jgi:hypothetical protein